MPLCYSKVMICMYVCYMLFNKYSILNAYDYCILQVLICFAFLVTTKQFVGAPIHCWCPAQFTDSHREYTDAVCWVSNTYYLPIERTIPGSRLDEAAAKIGYYQWVPLLLAGQAVLAFLPCQLWRFLCQRSGVNLAAIMDAAHVTSDAGYLEVSTPLLRF